MRKPQTSGAVGAIVIPFPRYQSSAPRKAARPRVTTPDFDAGFECAMNLMLGLKASGLLSSTVKGA